MSSTRSIREEEWEEFLDSLSREMSSRPVTVQVVDPELGYQLETGRLPFVGASADLNAGGGPRIEVMVGTLEANHTTHSIMRPRAVRIEEDDQGAPEVLEIEAADGSKTLVLLRPAEQGEPGDIVKR